MRQTHHPTIRTFNPGTFQSDDEIIEQFVVREHELATVLEILRGNVDADSCQHTLIVAPRGRGETMLLARVAAELRTNRGLSSHLLPIRFMKKATRYSVRRTSGWTCCSTYPSKPVRRMLNSHETCGIRTQT